MKMITIAAAMALAATPAFAATQIRASYDRSTTVTRHAGADARGDARGDLGAPTRDRMSPRSGRAIPQTRSTGKRAKQ